MMFSRNSPFRTLTRMSATATNSSPFIGRESNHAQMEKPMIITKRWAPLALVVAALAMAVPPSADAGSIVTSGYGEVMASPDLVDIRFEVTSVDDHPLAAVQATAEKYKSIQAVLGKLCVKQGDIVTTSFRVVTKQERNPQTGVVVTLGQEAIHAIKMTVNDFAKIGPIVDAAMAAGATRLSGLDFRTTAAESLNSAALESAVQRALQSATLMATAAGGQLGALVEMNSEGHTVSDAVDAMSMAAGVPAVPIVIVPDKLVVRKRVSAKWEFVER